MRNATQISPTPSVSFAGRWLLAVFLLLALAFNPIAMRSHMASAATNTDQMQVMASAYISANISAAISADLHAQHQAQLGDSGVICPQMAPCTAVLGGYSGALLGETPVARLALPLAALADGRALAPPFHPPIA